MGSSPNRVGGKETEIFSAQGGHSAHFGTESAGITRKVLDPKTEYRKRSISSSPTLGG